MPDVRDNPENRDEDHQRIEEMVRRKRNAAIELANVGRKIRWLVRRSPHKSGDDEGEIDKPDATMDVDPERTRLLRDILEQETQRSEKNDQRSDGPVEGDGGRAIPCERWSDALPGRENVHAIARGFFYRRWPVSGVARAGALATRLFCGLLERLRVEEYAGESPIEFVIGVNLEGRRPGPHNLYDFGRSGCLRREPS